MKFGFIGAGKVGFSLGKYFKENGILLSGYYSKNQNSSKEAANFTDTKQFLSLKELVKESDGIFITTPDGEIQGVWNEIKELSINNKLICHCSGLLSSEIFSDINKHGAYPYSIHPMFALSDKYNSYKNFKNAFITIEGHEKYIDELVTMIKNMGNQVKIIDKENKSLYHLASVMSSNLVLGLISNGVNCLKQCGFSEELAIDALYPLITNNIENIKASGTVKSLTGPLERGDLNTIKCHSSCLDDEDKNLYKALNKNLLKVAKEKNKSRDYSKIERFLGDED
ncbi:MAG: Rossmann-like and DUF2520 domain-containing protein [Clostridium sp.]|uniref:Rossmann-like and DUF2520 domain-containing protein n=1 Tax=Clostridium sp. TaxID=1506 RepID=UPI00306A465C